MTSLNTHIPIEYIKKSEKLVNLRGTDMFWRESKKERGQEDGLTKEVWNSKWYNFYPAPTIADIIDNAEELFVLPRMKNTLSSKMMKVVDNKYQVFYKMVVDQIIVMCQQNKPIEEISEYILTNITNYKQQEITKEEEEYYKKLKPIK